VNEGNKSLYLLNIYEIPGWPTLATFTSRGKKKDESELLQVNGFPFGDYSLMYVVNFKTSTNADYFNI